MQKVHIAFETQNFEKKSFGEKTYYKTNDYVYVFKRCIRLAYKERKIVLKLNTKINLLKKRPRKPKMDFTSA